MKKLTWENLEFLQGGSQTAQYMYDPYKTINLHSFTATPQWELSFLIKGPHVFQEPLRSIGEMLVEYSGMGVCLGGGVEARKKK